MSDLDRCCTSQRHLELLNSKSTKKSVKWYYISVDSDVNELISSIKVTGFVAKHNLPFGTAETYSQV